MRLAIICNEDQQKEFLATPASPEADIFFATTFNNIDPGTDVLFDLLFDGSKERMGTLKKFLPKPVFINAVVTTLQDLQQPFIRINAWPGFIQRSITEIAALPGQEEDVARVFNLLNRSYKLVPDWPGMISARIIAMIINEAWFTFGDGVSSREEIDLAMKSGTNYPFGPFEWCRKIGLQHIYDLLYTLSIDDKRYQPAPALLAEAGK
jgi:3-hydroxybutyryl-CoA dehydrogenase